jgi:hypothetical protein
MTPSKREAIRRASAASAAAKKREAVDAYKTVLPLIRELRQRGLSYARIATELTALGHTTRTGCTWRAAQVWNVLARGRQG